MRVGAGDTEMIIGAIRSGFESMKPDKSDHDNIIRLMGSMDGLAVEIREMRRDSEARAVESGKAKEALEARLRNLEAVEPVAKGAKDEVRALEDRVRTVELGGAKLSGAHAALVFIIPTLISGAMAFILRH